MPLELPVKPCFINPTTGQFSSFSSITKFVLFSVKFTKAFLCLFMHATSFSSSSCSFPPFFLGQSNLCIFNPLLCPKILLWLWKINIDETWFEKFEFLDQLLEKLKKWPFEWGVQSKVCVLPPQNVCSWGVVWPPEYSTDPPLYVAGSDVTRTPAPWWRYPWTHDAGGGLTV